MAEVVVEPVERCLAMALEHREIIGVPGRELQLFLGCQGDPERPHDVACEPLLQGEDLARPCRRTCRPRPAARPLVSSQVRGNPELLAGLPHAAAQHETHAELASKRPHVLVGALEPHRGTGGDDAHRADAGEIRDHFLGEPVGEVLRLRIGDSRPRRAARRPRDPRPWPRRRRVEGQDELRSDPETGRPGVLASARAMTRAIPDRCPAAPW